MGGARRLAARGLTAEGVAPGVVHARASFETTVGEADQAFRSGGLMSFILGVSEDGLRLLGGHVSSPRPGEGSGGG